MIFYILFLVFIANFAKTNTEVIKCHLEGTVCTFSDLVLEEIDMSIFQPDSTDNDKVETVKFLCSKIHTWTEEICNVFPNLKILSAEELSLQRVTPYAFRNCKKLKNISFLNNKLTHLDSDLFSGLSDLEFLSFEDNNLTEIDGKMFENLINLQSLCLDDNYLTEFPVHNFPKLQKLKVLQLSANYLRDLDVLEIIKKFPALDTITLNYNNFHCNRLKFIVENLKNKNINYSMVGRNANRTIDGIECLKDPEEMYSWWFVFFGIVICMLTHIITFYFYNYLVLYRDYRD